jgi:hypothetical protein
VSVAPSDHEASRILARTRSEDELTALMGLAARRHNSARLAGTATSRLAASKAKARLKVGMLAMMWRLEISPQEYDGDGTPLYRRNKLCKKLLEMRIVADSGVTVRLDEVEAWAIAQKHLWKLHEALLRTGLEDESIFDRNLAPFVNSWYRRNRWTRSSADVKAPNRRNWDTEGNAIKEAERRLDEQRAAHLPDDLGLGPPSADPSPEALVVSEDERRSLRQAVRDLAPMHRLVFLLGYDLNDLSRFRIPPQAIIDLVTHVMAGACDTVEGTDTVVEVFNDGRQETVGPETLRMAIRVIMVAFKEQPELETRSWKKSNVWRVVREVDMKLSAVTNERIRRRARGTR